MNTPPDFPSEPADQGEPARPTPDASGTATPPPAYEPPPWWAPQYAAGPGYHGAAAGSALPPPDWRSGTAPGWGPPPAEPPAPRGRLARTFSRPRAKVGLAVAAALIVGAGAGVGVTAATVGHDDVASGTGSVDPAVGGTGGSTGTTPSLGQLPQGTFPGAAGNGSRAGTSSSVSASSAQSVGVVDINTVDGYEGAQAAGTGLVLTGDGEILTNNHVVDGATKISVIVVSTGRTYAAEVVGTSPTNDIAVLQLTNASGLKTADLGDTDSVDVGDAVTGVGNAGGDGGTPSAARGTVTALNKTITASDESGAGAETLSGMIVTNAPIEAGDSGGPLYDADNQVVGIDTAAATSGASGTTTAGYAIPIEHALTIAKRIESGTETSTIHIGYPAFLGVGFARSTGRPTVSQVYASSPAAKAGLEAGDVITAVDGTSVTTYAALHSRIATYSPGDSVRITYTDPSGTAKTATVTLATGPAD